jgi:hypothetical protein
MSIIFSACIPAFFGFRSGFIAWRLPIMIERTEGGTCVSTIDIPSAIRYIQATRAGQADTARQCGGSRRLIQLKADAEQVRG